MKQLLLFSCIVLLLSCGNNTTPSAKTEQQKADTAKNADKPTMVGNDGDEHGCKPSTGYQWSAIRKTCVRLFETGIRLEAKGKNVDKTTAAFILFATDENDGDGELFLPNNSSILLKKIANKEAGMWKADTFTLTQWRGVYTLEGKKGNTLYEGTSAK